MYVLAKYNNNSNNSEVLNEVWLSWSRVFPIYREIHFGGSGIITVATNCGVCEDLLMVSPGDIIGLRNYTDCGLLNQLQKPPKHVEMLHDLT